MSHVDHCRSCGATAMEPVLDLGVTAFADRLLRAEELSMPEPSAPLRVVLCPVCALVQLDETVPPELLFGDSYLYYSSVNDYLLAHARTCVEGLIATRGLSADSFVLELASNDGYLLRNYVAAGVPCLGIDPVAAFAEAAAQVGVETRTEFFTDELAERLAANGMRADVIHANNVLAHVADTNGFVAGIARLLADDGVAVFEMPYLRDLIEGLQFDTIYHQHLLYFSVHALDALFARHGLHLNDVERLPVHGGSLRITVERNAQPSARKLAMLAEEEALGMCAPEYYRSFAGRVHELCAALRGMLESLRADGRRVAAYGAAAKGATLLQVADIGTDLLDFVVDRNVHKHGRFMPGKHLPILPVERLLVDRPDDVLILPWNARDEIQAQQAEYLAGGGRFLVPVPWPAVLEPIDRGVDRTR
jgi:SAM-dependent methyltransferase